MIDKGKTKTSTHPFSTKKNKDQRFHFYFNTQKTNATQKNVKTKRCQKFLSKSRVDTITKNVRCTDTVQVECKTPPPTPPPTTTTTKKTS